MPLKPRCVTVPSIVVLSALLLTGAAFAQSPTITSISPGAAKPGATVDLTVRGKNLAGVTQLWTSIPAKAVLAPGIKNNGKNAAQAVFRVTLPKEAPVGVHGIRVVSPNGVSALKLFVVDDLRTVPASGKNTAAETAQPVKTPVAIEGAIPNLGRHFFQFDAQAGQRLSVEAVARRIGSPLDPMFRLYHATDDGLVELAYSDDTVGLFGDAQLSHQFAEAGKYVLELRDIRFQGGGTYVYRLRIGDFPCVTVPYPMGAKRGSSATLSFGGSDIASLQPTKVQIPSDPNLHWLSVGAKRKGGQSSGFATLAVSDSNETLENEPNDELKQATRVTLGANINGRLEKPGDVDRFVFTAKKGQRFTFDAITRSQGSPTDLYMQLQDAKGKKLAESDDTGTIDGAISYTFKADGDYQLFVQDLNSRGGPEFVYRVRVGDSSVPFRISAAADHVNIPAGGTAAVTVSVARTGYNGAIELSAEGLPKGVSAVPTVLGAGRGEVVMTFLGTKDAKPGPATPIRIVGKATIGKKPVTSVADINAALKTLAGGYPFPSPTLANAFVAAVAPQAPFAVTLEKPTVKIPRGKKGTVKLVLSRTKDITEAVTIALTPVPRRNTQKAGLPTGLTVAVKPIPKGKNEVVLTISTTNKVPKGEFTATLLATHKKGKSTVTQNVPGILVVVE